MIDVPETWTGGIDDLVTQANRWLSVLLPEDRALRPKMEVNPRLVRHYTTEGLLPAAGREGRDARYTRQHLLALLALRRLMADGLSGKALYAALREKSEADLERLAVQGSASVEGLTHEPEDSALSYLKRLKGQTAPRRNTSEALVLATPSLPGPAPEPLFGAVGLFSPNRSDTRRRSPQQLVRLEIRPGLELMVDTKMQLPTTEDEWTHLLREVRATLSDATAS